MPIIIENEAEITQYVLDLSSLRNIEVVKLEYASALSQPLAVIWAHHALSSIRPQYATLRLMLEYHKDKISTILEEIAEFYHETACSQVDTLLSPPAFASLKAVTLEVSSELVVDSVLSTT
ncbi:hypothetical protein WOLCODRAFT_148995 [Wolfiporia cocos MD-104 SS10]|uniref:Uncharacterized protein n=1 Tax=Wolfiporia cocos (strain MD-104) TaxID=742152 RepID=A0A2H3JJW1_WOLCO|nr:hypothetical protein WOLCODRAFT_148995 [Wolfiporia cocos MD-104 SS10]